MGRGLGCRSFLLGCNDPLDFIPHSSACRSPIGSPVPFCLAPIFHPFAGGWTGQFAKRSCSRAGRNLIFDRTKGPQVVFPSDVKGVLSECGGHLNALVQLELAKNLEFIPGTNCGDQPVLGCEDQMVSAIRGEARTGRVLPAFCGRSFLPWRRRRRSGRPRWISCRPGLREGWGMGPRGCPC